MTEYKKINLSKLDRSTIFLFNKVKDVLIPKIISRWVEFIQTDNRDTEIFKWNLISAFCNLIEMLDVENDFEKIERETLIRYFKDEERNTRNFNNLLEISNEDLIELLYNKGYLLFNFYFYKIIDAYGEKYLNPVIVGFDYVNQSYKDYNRIYGVLNDCKISFRIYNSQKYIKTYKNQLLPIHGGLTPFYTYKNFTSEDKKELPISIDNFLMHLSVLHKREDYMQGHFSALIKVIRNHKIFSFDSYPIFTTVLSSMIPEAFTEQDKIDLNTIIKEIEDLGYFSELTGYSSLQNILIKPHIWSYHNVFDENVKQYKQLNDSLKNIVELFQNDVNNNLIYIYNKIQTFKSGQIVKDDERKTDNVLTLFTININSIENIINKLFPSGPWFETNIFYRDGWNNYEKLRRYIKVLNNFLYGYDIENISEFKPLEKFIRFILPESTLQNYKLNIKVEALSNDYQLILISNENKKNIWIKHKTEIEQIKEIFNGILTNYGVNIDGQNPDLLNLHNEWLEYNTKNTKLKDFYSESLKIQFSKNLLNDIRAFIVVRDSKIYIPVQNKKDSKFFNNYQEFWTFQSTLYQIYNSESDINDFNKYEKTAKHLYKYKNSPIKVIFGTNRDENIKVEKALLYYGIEIGEVEYTENSLTELLILPEEKGIESDKFYNFYSNYIYNHLIESENSDIIKSIFGKEIKSIEVSKNDDNTVKVRIKLKDEVIDTNWKEYNSIEPELFLVNYLNLNEYYSRNEEAIFNSKTKDYYTCNECDGFQCKFKVDRWEFSEKLPYDRKLICKQVKEITSIYNPLVIKDLKGGYIDEE